MQNIRYIVLLAADNIAYIGMLCANISGLITEYIDESMKKSIS